MNLYEKDEKLKLKIRLNRGRYTLLFMLILTIVDVFIVLQNNVPLMPFSSAIATYSMVYALMFKGSSTLFFVICMAVVLITLTALVFCYIKSKKNIVFIVFSMCFVAVDSLVLIVLSIAHKSYDSILIVNLIIHAMTIFYFWASIKAHKKLSDIYTKRDSKNEESDFTEDNEDMDNNDDDSDDEQEFSLPLRPYRNDGTEPILSGNVNGLNVLVVIRNNLAELVINNKVCCEQNTTNLDEYELRVIVNDIDFVFQYKRLYDSETLYLYADDQLLDSLKTN